MNKPPFILNNTSYFSVFFSHYIINLIIFIYFFTLFLSVEYQSLSNVFHKVSRDLDRTTNCCVMQPKNGTPPGNVLWSSTNTISLISILTHFSSLLQQQHKPCIFINPFSSKSQSQTKAPNFTLFYLINTEKLFFERFVGAVSGSCVGAYGGV